MPVDFGDIVVRNNMEAFALPIVVIPVKSAPRVPPYTARGIWSRRHLQILLGDGAELNTSTLKVSIYDRDPQFAKTGIPVQGDQMRLTELGGIQVDLQIDDVQPDGQGGVDLICKFLRYPELHA